MATFISHPLFGAGASYLLQRSQSTPSSKRFILISTFCQWIPDIDTLSYLFSIDEQHSLGHRGLTHSGAFALVLAYAVMMIFYRSLKSHRLQWWVYYICFFDHSLIASSMLWYTPLLASPFFGPLIHSVTCLPGNP